MTDWKYYQLPHGMYYDFLDPDLQYFMFLNCIAIAVIGAFGMLGNTITMVVLWRIRMEECTLYILRALVIADMVLLVFDVSTAVVIAWTHYYRGTLLYFKYHLYPMTFPYIRFAIDTSRFIDVWILVAISTERFIAICHPFLVHTLLTRNKTIVYIATIIVLAFILTSTDVFVSEYEECPHFNQTDINISDIHRGLNADVQLFTSTSTNRSVASNSTVTILKVSFVCLLFSTEHQEWFEDYIYYFRDGVMLFVLPTILLATLNGLLVRQLMIMRRRRMRMGMYALSEEDDYEMDVSFMLILVMVIFLVCHSVAFATVFPQIDLRTRIKLITIANTLIVFNSSVNFVIYTTCGLKFRRTLLLILRRGYRGIADNLPATTTTAAAAADDDDDDNPAPATADISNTDATPATANIEEAFYFSFPAADSSLL